MPITQRPTDTEWANYCRWAIGPLGNRRQLWVEREAQAIFTARTGLTDPFPEAEDFAAASAVIPREG